MMCGLESGGSPVCQAVLATWYVRSQKRQFVLSLHRHLLEKCNVHFREEYSLYSRFLTFLS